MIGLKHTDVQFPRYDSSDSVLFYGIGNPSRGDDALGPTCVEGLRVPASWGVDSNYQLNAEDALLISEYSIVIFVDATREKLERTFCLSKFEAADSIAFSSHAMTPSQVLGLCVQLYQKRPQCFLLGIRGESWELGDELSPSAKVALTETIQATQAWIDCPNQGADHA
jgi:hydrogenase maturation protease